MISLVIKNNCALQKYHDRLNLRKSKGRKRKSSPVEILSGHLFKRLQKPSLDTLEILSCNNNRVNERLVTNDNVKFKGNRIKDVEVFTG